MNIGFVFYPKALLTGVSLSAEMLRCAGALRPRELQRRQPINIQLLTVTQQNTVATLSGLSLHADNHFSQAEQLDLLVIPPLWGNPSPVLKKHADLLPWIIQQYSGGAKVVATGTGVCWLAECGLLNDGVATTHWYFAEQFRRLYPDIQLNSQAAITESNDVYCTASINSQTEMVVYLIKQIFGIEIAHVIEKHFSHEVTSSGEQPFYQQGGNVQFDESIALVLAYIDKNLSNTITIKDMAASCDYSLRTFSRKFTQQVGQSPNLFLQSRRMDEAKRLLRDMSLRIGDVANLVGYQNPAYFSKTFCKHFALTPKAYRNMASAKMFN